MTHKSINELETIKDFNRKTSYIRQAILTKKLYDWDVVFLSIPILSILISIILLLNNINLAYNLTNNQTYLLTPFNIYINSMLLVLLMLCPPFLICWFLRYIVSKIRKKIFTINLNPCIFTTKNTAILSAILLPFIFTLFYCILNFVNGSSIQWFNINLSWIISNYLGTIFDLSHFSILKLISIDIVVMLIALHICIYFIFLYFYKLFDKHYQGETYNNFLRRISRSTILTWLIPFLVSLSITCAFYLII